MTRNHASGGVRVSVARSHARRQSAAETRATPVPDRTSPITAVELCLVRLPDYLSPGGLPGLERHTVVLAVVAGRERCLPELQRLEVGLRRIRVVAGARALRDRVHDRAGLLVRG